MAREASRQLPVVDRRKPVHRASVSALVLVALGSWSPKIAAAQVWVAPAAIKLRPGAPAPAGAAAQARLAAAKNEFESFQVGVTGPASGVSMSLESLSDGRGHRIGGTDIVLYREALIDLAEPTGSDGAAGPWPDALVPDLDPLVHERRAAFPFEVPPGQQRAVFVDIHVPLSAPAGVYAGTLSVTGGASAQVPVELVVWDFALPSTASLASAFGMAFIGPWLTPGEARRVVSDLSLRDRYLAVALDNRITIDTPARDVPVQKDGSADWGAYDEHVAPFLTGGAPTRLASARMTAVTIQSPLSYANTPIAAEWSRHFRARGWMLPHDYACDEPPRGCAFSDIDPRIALAHAADPALVALVTTTAQLARQNGVQHIDLFVPLMNQLDDRSGPTAGSQRGQYPASVFWYQSCESWGCGGGSTGLWPSYAIDVDATRNRAMEWLSFTYRMTGELYFDTTHAFDGDPWTVQRGSSGNGDGTLFYPGTPARIGGQTEIPIESLRLKMIRDGMEDYELLHLAEQLGHGAEADAIARSVYPRTFEAVTTPAALDAARAQLAALILGARATTPGTGADGGPAPGGGPAPDAGSALDGGPAPGGGPGPGLDGGPAPDGGPALDGGTAIDGGSFGGGAGPDGGGGAGASALPPTRPVGGGTGGCAGLGAGAADPSGGAVAAFLAWAARRSRRNGERRRTLRQRRS